MIEIPSVGVIIITRQRRSINIHQPRYTVSRTTRAYLLGTDDRNTGYYYTGGKSQKKPT